MTIEGLEAKYSLDNYLHQLEKIYESLINLDDCVPLKEKYRAKLRQLAATTNDEHRVIFLWTLCLDSQIDEAKKIYDTYFKGKEDEVFENIKNSHRGGLHVNKLLQAIYLIKTLSGESSMDSVYETLKSKLPDRSKQ